MTTPAAWKNHLPELREVQPWPRYYEFRSAEMETVQALCTLPRGGTMLELGCGNAFHSYLLSDRFERIIATDLYTEDATSHTIGLRRAARLARILSFDKLLLAGASAEALPLAEGSVDFVFSSNVLEHVPDQRRAVREMLRVLRPGGQVLTIVPAAMERVYNLPASYVLMLLAVYRGLRPTGPDRAEGRATGSAQSSAARPRRRLRDKAKRFFTVHFPGFPFPNPHGAYTSSTREFLAHRPGRWEALFDEAGFEIGPTFSTILAPHTLGMAVSYEAAYRIARAGWPLTRRLGALPGLKRLGTSFAILARRPLDARGNRRTEAA
jgi:SAM-dependent methyltransferase